MTSRSAAFCIALATLATLGCGADDPPPSPPCDQKCLDGSAVRALREMVKLVYNGTLFGNPVGPQDETYTCPQGGQARVFGEAGVNALQGALLVDLTYVFEGCGHVERDDEAPENYEITLTGEITQEGTIAVQPPASSSLTIQSDAVTLSGTVYDPPKDYNEVDCEVRLGQNGNNVSGKLCGRTAGTQM